MDLDRAAFEERAGGLGERLDAFEAGGGARFDRPGCRCVRALLGRAEALGSARILSRAEARMTALEQRLKRARADTEAAVDELAEAGAPGTATLREAVRRGDVSRARRGIRRIRILPPIAPAGAEDEAAGERYRRAAAEFSAAVTVARARANAPADAGPYNSTLVATHTLDRLASTSPTYLHALVERLEDLAALQSLAPPPPPAPRPARKRAGSAGPGKKSKGSGRRRKRSA